MIEIELVDDEISRALDGLLRSTKDGFPALDAIGEYLLDSTKQRFGKSVAPDGTPWAANSEVTILRYLRAKHPKAGGLFYKKDTKAEKRKGKLTTKGAGIAGGKKPLIGESGTLFGQISKHIGRDGLSIGVSSSVEYAAVQHFGAKKHQFGAAPWGDIPARPFLGLSEEDRGQILDILREHITKALQG